MVRVLAERTARWSLTREIGSGPPADSGTGRPKFADNVRQIMINHNAFTYMVDKILFYVGPVTTLGAASAVGDQKIQVPIPVESGSQATIDKDTNAELVTVTKVTDRAPFIL